MWATKSAILLGLIFALNPSAKANPTEETEYYEEESQRAYSRQPDPAQQAYNMFRYFMRNTPGYYMPYGSPPTTNFIPGFAQGYGYGGTGVPDFRQYIPQPPNIPTGTSYSYAQPGGVAVQASSADGKPVFRSMTSRGPNSYGTAFAYSS